MELCGVMNSNFGSLIIISLPENQEDPLKDGSRLKNKETNKNSNGKQQENGRVSGHTAFQHKCVKTSWVIQWHVVQSSLLGVVPCCQSCSLYL